MANDNSAVEAEAQKAATEKAEAEAAALKAKESDGAKIQDEDLLEVLQAKDEEIQKIAAERDNYKKGLLKAKGKIQDDEDETEDPTDLMRRIAREELLASQEGILRKEKDELIKKVLKENKELKLASRNREQLSKTENSTSVDTPKPEKTDTLSKDQIESLKKKGWDDKKIELYKKNLAKALSR